MKQIKYIIRYYFSPFFEIYLRIISFFSSKQKYSKKLILNHKRDSNDEIKCIVNYLKHTSIVGMYNYPFYKSYFYRRCKTGFDSEKGKWYILHNCVDNVERRLYLANTISSKYDAVGFYNSLCAEQDENSPHRYVSKWWNINEGDVLADVGAQEGLVAFHYAPILKNIYLIEYDKNWIDALNDTFEPFKNKTKIIPRMIGDKDEENSSTLDSVLCENVNLIKMDIEGSEIKALEGSKNLLMNKSIRWAICIYHHQGHELLIRNLCHGYGLDTYLSSGLVYINDENAGLRHAVLWALNQTS